MAFAYSYMPTPKVDCTSAWDNPDVFQEQSTPSGPTILLNYGICLFTLVLEIVVYLNINPRIDFLFLNWNRKLRPNPPAYDASNAIEDEIPCPSKNERSHSPTKYVRAYRCVLGTSTMGAILVCFILRMNRLRLLRMFPDCTYHDEYRVQPNWLGIFILSILPFTIGCTAWLRTVTDFWLFSKGKSVPYPTMLYPLRKGKIGWPPCLPLYVVYLAVAFPVSWTGLVKFEEKGKDEEMGGEELERLVGSGAVDDVDFEGPPSYEESCRIASTV
jgi:hypothetical protein